VDEENIQRIGDVKQSGEDFQNKDKSSKVNSGVNMSPEELNSVDNSIIRVMLKII